jgi:hypothetical protein
MCDAFIAYAEGQIQVLKSKMSSEKTTRLLEKTREFERFCGEDFGGEVEEWGRDARDINDMDRRLMDVKYPRKTP